MFRVFLSYVSGVAVPRRECQTVGRKPSAMGAFAFSEIAFLTFLTQQNRTLESASPYDIRSKLRSHTEVFHAPKGLAFA